MSLHFIMADAAQKRTIHIQKDAGNAASQGAGNVVQQTTGQAVQQIPDSASQRPAGQQQNAPFWANPIILMLVVLGVMFFFTFRSQKKQQQKRQQMLDTITKGTRVMLNTGMFGTVVEVRDKSYMIEIADKVIVEVVKNGVAEPIAADAAAPTAKK